MHRDPRELTTYENDEKPTPNADLEIEEQISEALFEGDDEPPIDDEEN